MPAVVTFLLARFAFILFASLPLPFLFLLIGAVATRRKGAVRNQSGVEGVALEGCKTAGPEKLRPWKTYKKELSLKTST
jgi:hypothetical protein